MGMALRTYPERFLIGSALFSLLILGLCGTVAWWLHQEQSRTADILGENITSRHAAVNLEGTLTNLIALRRRGVRDVSVLHAEVARYLEDINAYADKEQERVYARQIADDFGGYLDL